MFVDIYIYCIYILQIKGGKSLQVASLDNFENSTTKSDPRSVALPLATIESSYITMSGDVAVVTTQASPSTSRGASSAFSLLVG